MKPYVHKSTGQRTQGCTEACTFAQELHCNFKTNTQSNEAEFQLSCGYKIHLLNAQRIIDWV